MTPPSFILLLILALITFVASFEVVDIKKRDGTIDIDVTVRQDLFDEISPAAINAFVKDLKQKPIKDIAQQLTVPVLNKKINFEIKNAAFRTITIKSGRLTLMNGYGLVDLSGIDVILDTDVYTDGKKKIEVSFSGKFDARGKYFIKNNGRGTLASFVESAVCEFRYFDIDFHHDIIDWVFDALQFFFRGKIRSIVEHMAESSMISQIPKTIQPVYDNVTTIHGIAGDYMLYQFRTSVIDEPLVTPDGVRLRFQLKGMFRG